MKNIYILSLIVCLLGNYQRSVAQIANYDFNNCSGTIVNDNINNLNGTLIGASWDEGYNGQSINFDGINDKITVPHGSQLSITQAITVSSWIKAPEQVESTGVIAGKHQGGNTYDQRSWLMSSSSSNVTVKDKLQVVISEDGTNATDKLKFYYSSIPVFDDTWHHVAFTFESGALKLFIDGQEDVNVVKHRDDAVQNLYANTADLTIGYYLNNDLESYYFKGKIDELKIYNRAVTPSEITTLAGQASNPVTCGLVSDVVEIQALKDLYESTNGASWTNNTGWPTTEAEWNTVTSVAQMVNWKGIVVESGDVTWLDLPDNNLSGTLPSTLTNLTALERIYLQSNEISGDIPATIGNLEYLTRLYLQRNLLTGSIPTSIASLTQMEYLLLNDNQLSGNIPAEIGQLSGLYYLYLRNNLLTGSIPSSIGNLTNLGFLFLSNNDFTAGPIPESFGNLTNLRSVNFDKCNFADDLPSFIGNWSLIKYLYIGDNSFTGSIPDSWQNLTKLEHLYLFNNDGIIGNIPSWFGDLNTLKVIHLGGNSFKGAIPSELGNLTNLTTLNLHSNELSGAIPTEIGDLAALKYLYLQNNQLTGTIPESLGNLKKVQNLILSQNNLIGSIPSSLGNMTDLRNLQLKNNQLTGEIPSTVGSLINLVFFFAEGNQLSGKVPSDFNTLSKLTHLYIYDNAFTGLSNLTGHPNALSLSVQVGNNKITYGDIETNLNQDGTNDFSWFYYSGQSNNIPTVPVEVVVEDTQLTINTHDVSINNTYLWEKQNSDGTSWTDVTLDNENATGDKYVKTTTDAEQGIYRYTITNNLLNQTKISDEIEITTIHPNQVYLNQWAFQYKYDHRQRMVEKQVPGAGAVYMVYDNRDRLVLTQDANQRLKDQWIFTKYDILNRPVMTGVYTNTTATTRKTMQTLVNDEIGTTRSWYEPTGSIVHGYDNASFPDVADEEDYLTVTYYDDYVWNTDADYGYTQPSIAPITTNDTYYYEASAFTSVKGQVTGSKVKNLDDDSWLKSVSYYDDRYRVIQTITANQKGGLDRSSNLYDFVGKVLETKIDHIQDGLIWTDLLGTVENGDFLTKNADNGWNNGGAASTNRLLAGDDGWIEMEALGTDTKRILGLAETNPDASFTSINYAIYLNIGGVAEVREPGYSYTRKNIDYENGDKFKIERIGDQVFYSKNDIVYHTSSNASSTDLMVDVCIFTSGASIFKVKGSFFSKKSHNIKRNFDYDHAGRLMTVQHQLNSKPEVTLIANAYNELGELIDKKLHSTDDGATFEQSIDYRYNIRGWLTRINDAALSETETTAPKDYFGMEFAYNNPLTNIASTPVFNGNISAIKWSGDAANEELGYGYTYDPMNRLKSADYQLIGIGDTNNFDVIIGDANTSGYDLNGNIKSLTRNDKNGAMDILTYDYGTGLAQSNQLLSVGDTGTDEGFKDGNTVGDDYDYDENGNMTVDLNKGIATIEYNHLNLPSKVIKDDGQYIKYIYDAAGIKLAQEVYDASDVLQKRTDYIGEFIYERAYNFDIIEQTDFSQTSTSYGGTGIIVESNHDNILGEDDVLKVTSSATNTVHHFFNPSIGAIPEEQYIIEVDLYIPPNNTVFDGFGITNDGSQYILDATEMSKGSWVSFKTEPTLYNTGSGNRVLIRAMSGSTHSFVSNGEYAYMKNLKITKVSEDEGNGLAIIQHEEGRIVPDPVTGAFAYQYHLKDHLGNTRVTFTTEPKTIDFTLNYESDPNNVDDEAMFKNVNIGAIGDFNSTAGTYQDATAYSHAQILYSSPNSQTGSILAIPVGKGDRIIATVNAKYVDASANGGVGAGGIAASLITAFTNGAAGATEAGTSTIQGGFTDNGSIIGTDGFGYDLNSPKAFLNMMFLPEDESIDLVKDATFSYDQIENGITEAVLDGTSQSPFDELRIDDFEATQSGYLIVYVSNEGSLVDVYFDDLSITVNESKIIQTDDYYPFGLAFNSYQRSTGKENKYLYNDGSERITDLDLGVDMTKYRVLDPAIGRWWQVDPLADSLEWQTPYNSMDNNPIRYNDPDGDCPACWGAIIGFGVEYASQVVGNVIENGGNVNLDAFTNVDATDLLVATGAGAATGGLSALGATFTKTAIVGGVTVVNALSEGVKASTDLKVDILSGETRLESVVGGEKSIGEAAVEFTTGMLPAPDVSGKAVGDGVNAISEAIVGGVKSTLEEGINAGVKENLIKD